VTGGKRKGKKPVGEEGEEEEAAFQTPKRRGAGGGAVGGRGTRKRGRKSQADAADEVEFLGEEEPPKYICREDERPLSIAKALGIDVDKLVALNKDRYVRLLLLMCSLLASASLRLWASTWISSSL
jgi:hypothetical protein